MTDRLTRAGYLRIIAVWFGPLVIIVLVGMGLIPEVLVDALPDEVPALLVHAGRWRRRFTTTRVRHESTMSSDATRTTSVTRASMLTSCAGSANNS